MPAPPIAPETLAAAREDYEYRGLAVAEIARRTGLHTGTIFNRIRAEGWRRAPLVSALSLRHRLYAVLQARLEAFAALPFDPGAAERDAKVLGHFVQALARLAELDRAVELKPPKSAMEKETPADAQGVREELARRLSRLAEQAEARQLPEGAD